MAIVKCCQFDDENADNFVYALIDKRDFGFDVVFYETKSNNYKLVYDKAGIK